MHEEKVALTKNQIAALRRAAETRSIQDIFVVACGGSFCTPFCTFWIVRRMPSMYPLSMQRNSSITRHTGWEITAWLS